MTPTSILDTARTASARLRFSYTLLFAIALNFLLASGHDQQRCIELAVLAIALLGALASGQLARASQALPRALRGSALVFLGLGLCATIGTVSPSHALAEWSMFIMLGLAAIVVAAEFAAADAASRYRLLQVVGWMCGLYSLRVMLVYVVALATRVPADYQSLAVGFSNVRFLNHAQTALLPLLVLLGASSARASWARRGALLLAAFWWSLLLFSEARASVLALAVGTSVAWIARGRQAKPIIGTMLATLAAGVVLYLLLYMVIPLADGMSPFNRPDNVLTRSAADPASGRLYLWKLALQLIGGHPLLGVGPQHFAHFGATLYIGAHPHDWLLQIATEWGLPALLCVLILLIAGARGLLRASKTIAPDDHRNQAMSTALIVAVTGIVVDSLFSGVLVMPQSQMVLALVIGIAIGWARARQATAMAAPTTVMRSASAVLVIAAIGMLALIAGPDAARKWQGGPLTAQERVHNPGVQWPRLWEAGYF